MTYAKKRKNNLSSLLTYFAMAIGQLVMFGPTIELIGMYRHTLFLIVLFLLLVSSGICLITSRFSFSKMMIAISLIIASVLSYMLTESTTLPYLILLPLASMNTDYKMIIKTDLKLKIATTILISVCHFIGMTTGRSFTREGVVRETLGFIHPNQLGYICVIMVFEAFYLVGGRKDAKKLRYLAIAIVPLILCSLADSRTALLSIVVITVLFFIKDTINKSITALFARKGKFALALLPILFLSISIILTSAFSENNSIALKINDGLSGRIALQEYYSDNYKITLFGNYIKDSEFARMPLDNGYYRILYSNGLFGLISLLTVLCCSLFETGRRKDSNLAIILILLLGYALSEWTVFRLLATPLWVISFTRNNKNEEE